MRARRTELGEAEKRQRLGRVMIYLIDILGADDNDNAQLNAKRGSVDSTPHLTATPVPQETGHAQ